MVASDQTCVLARRAGFVVPVLRSDSISLRGRRESVVLHAIGRDSQGVQMAEGVERDPADEASAL